MKVGGGNNDEIFRYKDSCGVLITGYKLRRATAGRIFVCFLRKFEPAENKKARRKLIPSGLVAVVRREGLPDDHDDRGRFSARQTPKPETAGRFQAAMDDLAAVGRRIVLLSGPRCP